MTKVLIINESLRLGGAESISIELANALAQRNIKIFFAAYSGLLKERLAPNIDFFEISKYSLFSIKKIIDELSKIILQTQPNIIHNQGATLSVVVGIAIKKTNLKSANILTHHSKRFSRLPSFLAINLLNRYCDHIIAISKNKYSDLEKAGILPCKLSLIPNFIDCKLINEKINSYDKKFIYKELDISEGSYVITMAGRLIPSKRFDKFIEILAYSSRKTEKKLIGLIIGDGPMRKKLEKLVYNYSDEVKILFLGYQKDIFKYLLISNLFLFPSREEVLPMVLVESLAAGVPVICSNISGNDDIVENNCNGFLISGSIEEYSRAILVLINNKELRAKMSNNGIETVKNKFNEEKVVSSIISLYKKLSPG